MADATLAQRVDGWMRALTAFPDRHVGGEGNLAATELFASEMAAMGYSVRREDMPCLEWEPHGAFIDAGTTRLELQVGPYSLPFHSTAPLVTVSAIDELERDTVTGAIVLLHGEIAAGQYMPRNFTFYNPEEHRRVYRALDAFAPAAVIAATGRDPYMVGSQYPFPLFEDGDLDIPNAYLTDHEGEALLGYAGEGVHLVIESARRLAIAEHVVAGKPGTAEGRIVLTAHIDSRRGSPGALDNASGVATLLGAASLLRDYSGPYTLEFVPFNGEDDYANPGEMRWIAENEGLFGTIVLNINVDDSGQVGAGNGVSFYGCPAEVEQTVRHAMEGYANISEGPQWFQGDHSILGIYGRPAIAVASTDMYAFMEQYAHTERDVLELADPALIAETAAFIAEVVATLRSAADASQL